MKLLVIGSDIDAQVLASMYGGTIAPHKEGLKAFLEIEPDLVVVTGYDERINQAAVQVWKDLKNAADEETIIRIGLGRYDHPDYFQLPFKSTALLDFLNQANR